MNNWLTVVPRTGNNLILNKEEFRDQVLLRYLITPNVLPTICACGKYHTLNHELQCKIGGLIGGRHDKARDNLGCGATQAISPNAVCNNPRVQPCQDGKKGKIARVADQTQKAEEADVCVIWKKIKTRKATFMAIS
eukprot:11465486-Ditylum_brightwellii.AAC.1